MILKPRLDIYVAMILGGGVLGFVGFGSAFYIGLLAAFIPAVILGVVGVLGLLWIIVGVAALWRRQSFIIMIDTSGITIPTGNLLRVGEPVHIPRDAIATISRDESMRGRLIAIALRSGDNVQIEARHYCGLKIFLAHCDSHGLPTAAANPPPSDR